MADVLLCSVPGHDTDLVSQVVPDAAVAPAPFSEDVAYAHPETRVLSVMIHDSVEPSALEAMPRLEAVLTRSDGYDHLPIAWMRENGIHGYHLEGYATESVAHLALMYLIALTRRIPEATSQTRAGRWDRGGLVGHSLEERTVGIIGAGRIGGRLARILTGLGVQVVAYDIRPDPALEDLEGFGFADDLSALLEEADALSLHVPLDDSTRHLVGGDLLGRVRPGTILVNTARGGVVDTHAVADALDDGILAGFAADVLPGEPDVPDLDLLRDRPDALLSPHLGAHNHATIRRRYEATRKIVDALLGGHAAEVETYRVV